MQFFKITMSAVRCCITSKTNLQVIDELPQLLPGALLLDTLCPLPIALPTEVNEWDFDNGRIVCMGPLHANDA